MEDWWPDMPVLLRIGAIVVALWAGLHPTYQALIVLIAADIATGILASLAVGRVISTTISYRGLIKKSMELLMVAVGAYLEPYAGGVPLGQVIAGYWCANELLSIIENYGKAGLPVPRALRDVLEKMRPEQGARSGLHHKGND